MKLVFKRAAVGLGIFFSAVIFSPQIVIAQSGSKSTSPLQPMNSQYFHNQYLANPAMAGIDSGLHIALAYRNQLNNMPGAPVGKSLTADYLIGSRVGAGLMIYNDHAGLQDRTKVAGTYAYHLPLGHRNNQLHFGISLGLNIERIDRAGINGDPNDELVNAYNSCNGYFEVDYGMAYTDGGLTFQATAPNVMNLFRKTNEKTMDGSNFFASASYLFELGGAFNSVTPKGCFRSIEGYKNLVDIGANLVLLDKWANISAMYHTSENITVGAGVNYKSLFMVQAMYTTQTGGVKNYTSGGFEVALIGHFLR